MESYWNTIIIQHIFEESFLCVANLVGHHDYVKYLLVSDIGLTNGTEINRLFLIPINTSGG